MNALTVQNLRHKCDCYWQENDCRQYYYIIIFNNNYIDIICVYVTTYTKDSTWHASLCWESLLMKYDIETAF